MAKIKVGVFFGGRSSEHEISIQSAEGVLSNLDASKYDIFPICISKNGRFFWGESEISSNVPLAAKMLEKIRCNDNNQAQNNGAKFSQKGEFPEKLREDICKYMDVAFPVLHGQFCEDGSIQGLLRSLNVPFVGPDVLGSAICMDKDVAKRLLTEAKIKCAKGITIHRRDKNNNPINYGEIVAQLGEIVFVKSANLGSSIGVHKVYTEKEFFTALDDAFLYDKKVIVEEFINGREIECSVLGNEDPEASIPGEIIVKGGFYSYEAKYITDEAKLQIPADLSQELVNKIREIAVKTFKALCCEGMARVDFFVRNNSEIIVNEINTIPGFTKISMYPKMWEASGLSYSALLDKLISLAIARHKRDSKFIVA